MALNRLAALFHDLGKASVAFQAKLAAGSGSEAIRHDLMSFMMVAESLWTAGVTDEAWLAELAVTPAAVCRCASSTGLLPEGSFWRKRVLDRLLVEQGALILKSELTQLNTEAPALLTVLWLVLTHHRLPDADDMQFESIDATVHINKVYADAVRKPADASQCLLPHPGQKPWENTKWLANVAAAAQAASSALADLKEQNFQVPTANFWPVLAAHLLRPALILSDHIGSMGAVQGLPKKKAFGKPKSEVYANLSGENYAGDTLTEHLMKVSKLSRQLTGLALAPPPMPRTFLPPTSLALKTGLAGSYAWQEPLGPAFQKASKQGPVFGTAIAGTGTGKSLAAVRIMHYLSEEGMRFTLALGQRALTTQSAMSMLNDAGISPEGLMVAIGQPQTLGLDVQAKNNMHEDRSASVVGSESSGGSELEAMLSSTNFVTDWLESVFTKEEAKAYWNERSLAFLSAPIVACTVDHLVSAVSLLKGGDAKLFLRYATTDLVLDEIDAYSAQDLQAIGKLVFATGLHGHSVLLMSATLSPAIQEGLFNAWHQGFIMHCALKAKLVQFGTVFVSDVHAPVVLESPTPAVANSEWLSFVDNVCSVYAATDSKLRQMAVYDLQAHSLEETFAEIETVGLGLHQEHCVVDPATGKRVSIGFVRLSTAKNAWKMAQYLATRPAPAGENMPDVRFVSYHSKFPRTYLGVLDAVLGQMTRRKDDTSFLETPVLREVLDTSKSKDVVILVCTTTLIETGRDFDFDWCILEPRSVRGEIQAIGRVRRHRRGPREQSTPNVVLLSRPLSSLKSQAKSVWGRPGVEDGAKNLIVSEQVPGVIQRLTSRTPATFSQPSGMPARRVRASPENLASSTLNMHLAMNTLPLPQWSHALDAQLCLMPTTSYAENRIGYLEQQLQVISLSGEGQACLREAMAPSLHWYLTSFGSLNARHAMETRFRGIHAKSSLFVPGAVGVKFVDEVTGQRMPCLLATFTRVSCLNALISDLENQANRLATGNKHTDGASLRIDEAGPSTKLLAWDPMLGFLE
ncbi:MAG: HD domain-containing protein [Agitococcus sp.]|nr:HD domain-containing protein [Agitococcus sp.]